MKEGENWRGETSTFTVSAASKPQPFSQKKIRENKSDELGRGWWALGGFLEKEMLHFACLNLDKAPPVSVWGVWNALESCVKTSVSVKMILCEPLLEKKNVPLQHTCCKIGIWYSRRSVKYVYTVCMYVLYIYHRADSVYIRGFYFFALVSETAVLFSYVKILILFDVALSGLILQCFYYYFFLMLQLHLAFK